jgi:minor extracellular serine protease Vpr
MNDIPYIGTSNAVPYVAAAAALIKQMHTEWTPDNVKSSLVTTAMPQSDPSARTMGVIDVFKAINTHTLISPAHISFEPVEPGIGGNTQTRTLRIQNTGTLAKTYQLELSRPQSKTFKISGTLNPSEVTIPPQSITQITLALDEPVIFPLILDIYFTMYLH